MMQKKNENNFILFTCSTSEEAFIIMFKSAYNDIF